MTRIVLIVSLVFVSFLSNAQVVNWKVENGWVQCGKSSFTNIFVVGFYGIPGYSLNKMTEAKERTVFPNNRKSYDKVAEVANLLYSQSGYWKNYFGKKTKMIGTSEFPYLLKKKYEHTKYGDLSSYYLMNDLVKKNNEGSLSIFIDQIVQRVSFENGNYENVIWSPFDEVASGYKGWAWPTEVTETVYKRIKKANPNQLVFLNLLGGGIGNSFLFQEKYKKENRKLPFNPPFEKNAKIRGGKNLKELHVNHQGNPIFETVNGKKQLRKISNIGFEKEWTENIESTARGYRNSADIFGFNSYKSFYENPRLAGVTVDAIKGGAGKETPVWLFFDVSGHARPKNTSQADYSKSIRAQIYISIIHGASGVLFWSANGKSADQFNFLLPTIVELKKYQLYFSGKTIDSKTVGEIQYVVKANEVTGKKILIAINTNRSKSFVFSCRYSVNIDLNPLQIFIKEF